MYLDQYDDALVMMAAVEGDKLDPQVESDYLAAITPNAPGHQPITRVDRFDFYDRTRNAFAVIMTGETAKYGNILLKKGVTPFPKRELPRFTRGIAPLPVGESPTDFVGFPYYSLLGEDFSAAGKVYPSPTD